MPASPASQGRRSGRGTGAWYFVITVCSVGLLTWLPFAHAASRLGRRDLRLRSWAYGLASVALIALAAVTPENKQGNPIGSAGEGLSTIVGFGAIAVVVIGCVQLGAARRVVYGPGGGRPVTAGPGAASLAAADPAIAAYLANRARREEARSLALGDPVLAHDLRIGRPDLSGPYNDGGLVDLNSAPAEVIARVCSVEPAVAERIVAARGQLQEFSSLDEVFAFADVPEGPAAQLRDHALVLPR